MRTLLVSGKEAPPPDLLSLVRSGSASVDEVTSAQLSTFISREAFGVDRVVFWAPAGDHDVRALALNYATAAGRQRRETVFFVTPVADEPAVGSLAREEMYVWPRDQEKFRRAFTGEG